MPLAVVVRYDSGWDVGCRVCGACAFLKSDNNREGFFDSKEAAQREADIHNETYHAAATKGATGPR